jgi:hypothetical protein
VHIRDPRPDEVKIARSSRNPERDAIIDRLLRDARAGKPKVIEMTGGEKQVTLRAAINKRILTTSTEGVRVRSMGKTLLIVEPSSVPPKTRRRRQATADTQAVAAAG